MAKDVNSGSGPYFERQDSGCRVPYGIVRRVVFTNVKKSDMIDMPHAARLQYRLMLLDPVIKAAVDFTTARITVIYNPDTADNNMEKTSLRELKAVLGKEGIRTDKQVDVVDEDYDYYKNFYAYAYAPSLIRESIPYGYTAEQWRKMKPGWERKVGRAERARKAQFKKFQKEYLEENPEMAQKIDPSYNKTAKKRSLGEKILGGKRGRGGGFWSRGA